MWFGAEAVLGLDVANGQYLEDTFDHVLFCLPPGTTGGWIAEGWSNHPFSIYNNAWCLYPSAMQHEIGHNYGLEHAKDFESEYGDRTGVMGSSIADENGPKMCFNTANSYKLGWYVHQQLDWDPITQGSLSTRLVGVVDYNATNDDLYTNVVVRLGVANDDAGYYIGYNKAEGFNSGTMEGPNMVTVTEYGGLASDGTGTMTDLRALLYQGEEYRIENYRSGAGVGTVIVRWTGWSNDAPLVDVYMAG
jgi:hypothetical protein